ncbi:helix-turn-helix transcriptional regulator [Nocardia sp. 348MFTsu5.1]|uniref:helix-turn-helix transcriptional regulator n=1 Tax=Nocardia sp. 348MFTsu5.1 TaxID=1172185 RepID=UPI00056C2628|nr:AraC family transcriptional regulator [Nocardia sp. 348MFTsu5.1]
MASVPTTRHLLRARDLIDVEYSAALTVDQIAAAAGLSRAHFTRAFTKAFGQSPHLYLQTRRLERAAALLRNTDYSVADVCVAVGLRSVGSFTTSFKRTFGETPAHYRASRPPAAQRIMVPACVVRAFGRPYPDSRVKESTGGEDRAWSAALGSNH